MNYSCPVAPTPYYSWMSPSLTDTFRNHKTNWCSPLDREHLEGMSVEKKHSCPFMSCSCTLSIIHSDVLLLLSCRYRCHTTLLVSIRAQASSIVWPSPCPTRCLIQPSAHNPCLSPHSQVCIWSTLQWTPELPGFFNLYRKDLKDKTCGACWLIVNMVTKKDKNE